MNKRNLIFLLLYYISTIQAQETTAQSWVSVRVDPTRSIFSAPPRFDQQNYELFITENQSPAVITTLRAFHRAASLHQDRLIYSLLTDEKSLPFSIEANSGQLAVLQELDREQKDRYNFQVRACLFMHPQMCGLSTVTLFINDLNDNTPKFPARTYHIVVPNDLPKGSEVVQLTARDMDTGSNGMVSYAINPPSETFAIDHSSGQVSLLRVPEKSRYSLIIEAFDHGVPRRTTYAELRLTIEGSNPSAPQFDQTSYIFKIEAPIRMGQVVGSVHATDPDPGEDGMVNYSFSALSDRKTLRDQQKFSINQKTGSISSLTPLTTLDGPFHLIVIASDQNAIFSRKTQVNVKIEIGGGERLRFLPLPSIIYISSEKPKGSIILRASAYASGSSDVSFRVLNSPQEFMMDGDLLKVVSPLRRGDFNITIRAETELTSVDHLLRVVVMNDRDKYPVFPKLSYDLEIPIEARFPLILTRFEPQLENGTVKFSLFPSNRIPNGVSIDERTGTLMITRDYIDSPTNRDTVFVVVRALNSNFPDFYSDIGVSLSLTSSTTRIRFEKQIYEASVRENSRPGTVILQSFEMSSGSDGLIFSVTPPSPLSILPNGSLAVGDLIDLEKLPVDEDGSMIFVITASDGEQSASTKIRLAIQDVNEFLPKFDYMHYQAHIGEAALPGTPILKVHATDKDFFDGTHMRYRITGGTGKDLVKIQQDGTIVLGEKKLDRETLDHFDVLIEAVDSGENSAEARVDITVMDVNDNAPEIITKPLSWNISEGQQGIGATFTIIASDLDQMDNSKLTFSITDGNEEGKFELGQISPFSAIVRTVKPLDSDSMPIYKLSIEVKDSGNPPMMSVSTLTIHVKNENDKAPRFAKEEYIQAVPSDLPAHFNMLRVNAEDLDGNTLRYSILEGGEHCDLINIGPNGELSFVNDNRPDDLEMIKCTIEASDGLHSTNTQVIIRLEKTFAGKPNRANHPPKFEKSNYIFRVDLGTVVADPRGRLVGMVSASDNENDVINFSIEPVEYRNLFDVDKEGAIWLRSIPPSDSPRSLSFLIVATDMGEPQLASFANVRVTLSGTPQIEETTLNKIIQTSMSMDSEGTMATKIPELSTTVFTVADDLNTSELPTRAPISPKSQWRSGSISRSSPITTIRPALTVLPQHTAAHSIKSETMITRPLTVSNTLMSTDRPATRWRKDSEVDGGSEREETRTPLIDEMSESEEMTESLENQSDQDDTSRPFTGDQAFSEPIDETTIHQITSTISESEFHFDHEMYFASMPEGRYSNGALLNLRPEPLSTNARMVKYELADPSLPFHIREETGEIAILDVDREISPSFILHVIGISSDVTGFKMRAETKVNVTILDVNDNYPLFVAPPQSIGLSRDLQMNKPVLRIEAIDSDLGRNSLVSYEVQDNQWVRIDPQTGMLYTKTALTNAPQNFDLRITARDGGRPPLKTTHIMHMMIFSESSSPSLPREIKVSSIPYPTPNHHFITQVLAGPTIGTLDKIIYTLADDENGLFMIDSEGRLSLSREPNEREMNKYHQLNISARNSKGSDSILYNVFIEGPSGLNESLEKTPEMDTCTFPTKMYNTEVSENLEGRHKLIKITSDCEENQREYEYVLWQGSDQFEVDSKSGEVFVNGPLDREDRSIHFLFINVTHPSQRSKREAMNPVIEHALSKLSPWQTIVIIRVQDLNDNAPRFVRLSPEGKYSAVLDYQAKPRTPILRLQAQDNDEKPQFVYGIYGDDEILFILNSTTGVLSLKKGVPDDRNEFHLTGTVADGLHVSEIPITVHKLSPDSNLVQLIVEKAHNEVDEKLLERLLSDLSHMEIHALVKEPYSGDDGKVDPMRTFVYVYGLETKTKTPIERHQLKGILDRFSTVLITSEARISSVNLSSTGPSSLSSIDLFLLFLCLILLLIAFVVCCLVANVCKRRDSISSKDYMRSSPLSGPRPYDVSIIPRATAQAVLAGRPLPDPMQFSENKHSPGSSGDERRSTNRSDEQLVFSNSVREYGALP